MKYQGSPDVRVIGYFLLQHKAILGQKTVTKANIFHSTHRECMAVLVFTIADVIASTEVNAQETNRTAETGKSMKRKALRAF